MADKKAAELVRRCQAGDSTAFAEIYELYKNSALRAAFLITGNYCDSENVLQETFIKCYQKLPGLKEPESFKTWFFRILTRTAWEYCRLRGREQPVEDIFDAYQAEHPAGRSALDIVAETETNRLLLASINKLDLKQKTVVILYYYNGFSIQEIAAATGALAGTVKSRLHAARRNLQKALAVDDASYAEVSRKESRKESWQL